jgi:hypothetical protein
MARKEYVGGSFVPTTNSYDVSEVINAKLDKNLEGLLIKLYQNLNVMALNTNMKDIGYYNTLEFTNGQQWFPDPNLDSSSQTTPAFRPVNRIVINFGALPAAAGVKRIAHGLDLTSGASLTRLYGASSDQVNKLYVPIPYASATNDNIELYADATYVYVTVNSNTWATYLVTYIVLEYIPY